MTDELAQLKADLEEVEQALANPESLPAVQQEVILAALRTQRNALESRIAVLGGAGALAQDDSVAAGAKGVAVGGSVEGGISVTEVHYHRAEGTDLAPFRRPEVYPTLSKHNLPSPPVLVGRHAEIRVVCEALTSAFPVVTIQGIGGVGKSALALAVAHLCCELEDGQKVESDSPDRRSRQSVHHPVFTAAVWLDLKHRSPSLDSILETVALVLGHSELLRLNTKRRLIQVVQLLQSTRCLLVADNLDNVEDESVWDFLLTVPTPSKVLITTRRRRLLGTWLVDLGGLLDEEIAELVIIECERLGLGEEHKISTSESMKAIKDSTGGVPLGIKWILSAVKQRGHTLDIALNTIAQGTAGFYEDLFAGVWQSISNECRDSLFSIATFPAHCSLEALVFTSSISRPEALAAIDQLTELSLVESLHVPSVGYVRYELHPLTHHFVCSQSEYEEARERIKTRVIDFYSTYVAEHGGHKNWRGFSNIQIELDNIRGTLDWCIDACNRHVLVSMVKQMSYFWSSRGYWADYEYYVMRCVEATSALGDGMAEAHFKMLMSWLHRKRGELDAALSLVEEALEQFQEENHIPSIAWSTRELGAIAETKELFSEAAHWYSQSLELWEHIGRTDQISHLLKDLGELHRKWGKYEAAEGYMSRSLAIERIRGDPLAIANRASKLGQIAFCSGDYSRAEQIIKEGLAMHQEFRNEVMQAIDLWYLAQIKEMRQNTDDAFSLYRQAHSIFARMDIRDEPRILESILASIHRLSQSVGERR